MFWGLVLAHLALPGSVAGLAFVGAWRCWRLLRYARDPRLQKLAWFYALFGLSLVSWAAYVARAAVEVGGMLPGGGLADAAANVHGEFAAAQRVDGLLVAHHVLMLASLGVAVEAFGHKRGAAVAAAGLLVLAPLIPALLGLEAALTLYLAVRAVLNHKARRTRGALQVAAGFLLFFLGHLSYFVLYHPGGVRTPIGDVLSLVGVALLVQLLPRPSA